MNNGPEIQAILRRAAAMAEARCGQLVVYRNWAEFAKSAVWVIALPLGVSWMFEHQSDFLSRCAGLAFVVTGAMSVRLMVAGAFKYNSGPFAGFRSLGGSEMSRVTQVSTIHSVVVRVSRNVDAKPNIAMAPLRFGFWTIVTMPCIMHHVAYHVKETEELVLVFA